MKLQEINEELKQLMPKIEAFIDDVFKKNDVSEIFSSYYLLKEQYAKLDGLRKELYHIVDHCEKSRLPDKLESMGIDKVRVPELERSFYILRKYSASTVDREKAINWLKDNGHGDIVQETVNASTLTAFLKDMVLEENIDPPDDIFVLNSYNTIGTSKYKPK